MKQTLEKAAIESCVIDRSIYNDEYQPYYLDGFKDGAEWQAKQSPWISVKERLPEDTNEKLVALEDGTIRIAHYDEDYNEDMEYHFWYDCAASESYHRDDVIYWMPIPSFNDILEANRDVLERIKEKGD